MPEQKLLGKRALVTGGATGPGFTVGGAMTEDIREGGCLCGQVRYKVPAKPVETVVCHCRNCQKQAGSAFSVVVFFPRDSLQVEGELQAYVGKGSSGQTVYRRFCGNCGSPVITDTENAPKMGLIFIKAGTLDEVDDLRPSVHVCTSRKHCWLNLAEDQVQLEWE